MSRKKLFTLCLALLALLIVFLIPRPEPAGTESKVDDSPARLRPPSISAQQIEPRLSDFLTPVADEIRPHPLLKEGVLENGLRYQILTLPNPNRQISLRLVYDVGSFMEEEHERGIAHFLEHLVFNGTRNFPQGRAMEEFQRLGLKSGQHANAATSFEHTYYKLDLPDDSSESLTSALRFFRDTFDGLLLMENEINAERDIVLEELNLKAKRRNEVYDQLNLLLPNTLLAQRRPIGTPETIPNFSRDDFRRFHQKWYTPNRATLIIAGDIDPIQIEDLIREHFDSLLWRERGPDPNPGELPPTDLLVGDVRLDASSDQISLLSASPSPESKTSPGGFRKALINELVQKMIEARWERVLDFRSSSGSQLVAHSHDFPRFAQINFCDLYFRQDRPDLSFFLTEWHRLLKNGFLQSEFDQAKKDILFTYLDEVENLSIQSAATLADKLLTAHREKATFTSPLDDLARVRLSLRSIQLKECTDHLQSVWKGHPLLIQQSLTDQKSTGAELTNAYLYKQSLSHSHLREITTPDFKRPPPGDQSAVVSQKKFPKLKLTQLTLGNGLKINLRPTKSTSDLIYLNLTFGRGIHSVPVHHPGLKRLARASFHSLGIKDLPRSELERSLRRRLISWDYQIAFGHHLLSGICSREELLTQCQLLQALLTEPGWLTNNRRDFSTSSSSRLEKSYHNSTNTPQKYWYFYHNDFLTNSDSRFRKPDVPELMSTSNQDLRDWLKDDLLSHPLELTLTGDFEINEVLQTIQDTFGRLPQRDPEFPPLENPLAVFEAPSTDLRKIDEEGSRACVSYFFHTPRANASAKSIAQLTLLKSIFRNRVREHIRENLGLSYSPSVYFDRSDKLGDLNHFYATIPTSAESVPRVQEAMTQVIESFLNHPISEDELYRARLPIIKWQPLKKSSPYYWADTLSLASRQPDLIENLEQETAILEAVTLEDLQTLSVSIITYGACEFTITQ